MQGVFSVDARRAGAAADTVSITPVVRLDGRSDHSGTPVQVLDADGNVPAESVADTNGHYAVLVPGAGEFKLQAARPGWSLAWRPGVPLALGMHTAIPAAEAPAAIPAPPP